MHDYNLRGTPHVATAYNCHCCVLDDATVLDDDRNRMLESRILQVAPSLVAYSFHTTIAQSRSMYSCVQYRPQKVNFLRDVSLSVSSRNTLLHSLQHLLPISSTISLSSLTRANAFSRRHTEDSPTFVLARHNWLL